LKVRKFINTKFFKRDLTYELWLKNIRPLSSNELNQMEKESVNNSNFQPLKGA
jgi:hypothetical protein